MPYCSTAWRWALLLALASGCKQFYTVDEACQDKAPGEKSVSNSNAIEALIRINCYRRLSTVQRARFQKEIQESAENHATYMAVNEVWNDPGYLLATEDPEKRSFTGVTLFDRLDYVDYKLGEQPLGYRELLYLGDRLTGSERVDWTFHEPYFREFFLQLSVIGMGLAEAEIEPGLNAAYYVTVYDYPAYEHATRPVVYPKKDQLDVPTAYYNYDPRDAIADNVALGYPISVTVGARNAGGSYTGGGNPYDLNLKDVKVKGPDGELDFDVFLPPAPAGLLLEYTAVVVPLEPYKPNSKYTFTALADWDGGTTKEIDITFTTAKTETAPPDFSSYYERGLPAVIHRDSPPSPRLHQ